MNCRFEKSRLELEILTSSRYFDVSWRLAFPLLLLLNVLAMRAQGTEAEPSNPPVRITESVLNLLSTPQVANDCVTVGSRGRFHMERRLQIRPDSDTSVRIYEGKLNPSQQRELSSLLSGTGLKRLPSSEIPSIPKTSSFIRAIKVEIQRDSTIQSIGYADWSRLSISHENASTAK